ncbi:MAG: WG repeat-containing protein [Campylobacteraceae bacterium]|nr:WG repeat-containing protein [Campylobacteraceae bacterium]
MHERQGEVVKKDGKYGFINCNGEFAIPFQLEYIDSFLKNGLAVKKAANTNSKHERRDCCKSRV